jgi:hypothetical protein
MIVAPSADLEMALRAIVFSAVGTAGQRCTTLRRLIVHEDIYDQLIPRLKSAYDGLPLGDPLVDGTLVGPLIDGDAFAGMEQALEQAKSDGGRIHGGGGTLQSEYPAAHYATPAIAEMPEQTDIVRHETFAPILYVMKYRDLDHAIALHNGVVKPKRSSRPPARIAASLTSTSGHPVQKLVAHSVVKRTLAGGGSRAPMHGKAICAARPIPSITHVSCHWRRALNSIYRDLPSCRLKTLQYSGLEKLADWRQSCCMIPVLM